LKFNLRRAVHMRTAAQKAEDELKFLGAFRSTTCGADDSGNRVELLCSLAVGVPLGHHGAEVSSEDEAGGVQRRMVLPRGAATRVSGLRVPGLWGVHGAASALCELH